MNARKLLERKAMTSVKKRAIAFIVAMVLLLGLLPASGFNAFAATTSSNPPYAKIEYGYSSSTTFGTIRYISQNVGGSHFHWEYWPDQGAYFGGYTGGPGIECGTASLSMALSYIGINETPRNLLYTYNGETGRMWSGVESAHGITHSTPSVSTGISRYVNGNGKYSPPVIHIPGYSSLGHFVIVIGQISSNTYQILDPNECAVTTMTINGSSATYVKYGTTINDTIDGVHQWYNSGASIAPTYVPPGKPALKDVSPQYQTGKPVYFYWDSTSNTTHYNLYFHRKDETGVYVDYGVEFYAESGVSRTLIDGDYEVLLQSTNSNSLGADGTGWAYSNADYVYFSVGDFTPGKPTLHINDTEYHTGSATYFSWEPTNYTTHYNLYIHRQNDSGDYETYENVFYAESGLYRILPDGNYQVLLQSTNSNVRTDDNSTWRYTNADYIYFFVGDCTPGKPQLVGMKDQYEDDETVKFRWDETEHTTHYNLYFRRKDDSGEFIDYSVEFYAESGTTHTFIPGEYEALLQSTNSHCYTDDGSTWRYTNADKVYFTVVEHNSHTHDYVSSVTPPTCTEQGYTTHTCSCGDSYVDTYVPALGHNYELTGWQWTGYTAAKATFTCKNDSSHVQTVNATITNVRTEPTCEAPGKVVYTAKVTYKGKDYTDTKTQTLVALGHNWNTPTYTWAADNSTVTATRTCKNDASHVEAETVNTTSEVTTPATCTAKGKTTYTATFTNSAFSTQTKTVENVPALGHNWNTPTYTWAADNSNVTATRTCKNDANHVETETANTTSEVTTPATCTAKGKTTYTATFTNSAFATQTKTVWNVPALGHTPAAAVKENEIAAACTVAGGYDMVVYCSVCSAELSREHTTLEALGHNYELTGWTWTGFTAASATFTCKNDASHVEKVDATITSVRTEPTADQNGSVVYTAKVTFEGNEYTDTKTDILPALGHDYELSGWNWTDYTAAAATFTDKNGGDPITVNATITSERTEPTCTEEGKVVYTATVSFEGKDYTDAKTETLDALGHDWNKPEYVWAEDYSTVTATRTCKNDASHVETETANATAEVIKEATVDEEGEVKYTATFENEAFETQTQTVVTPKLDDPGDGLPCDGGDSCPGKIFTDMPAKDHWAHDAIDWAVVHDITSGTSATTFSPNASCTRAQVVTFLWRAAGSPDPTTESNPFQDVAADAWYYKAVLWASETGVTAGTSATTFSPNQTCTRGQIVTFIGRFEGSPEAATVNNPFADVPDDTWYTKAVLWASETGVTAGTSADKFSPSATCTRAQVVTFLYRDLAK